MSFRRRASSLDLNRRQLLRSGVAAFGAMLANVLRLRGIAQARGAERRSTSVVFVTLGGGPSQFETYDPKPDARSEYRGEFSPVRTSLPGVQLCELLPRQARLMDKLAIVRSVNHRQSSHLAMHMIETGYNLKSSANALTGEMPSVGSVASRVRGTGASGIPAFVSLPGLYAYSEPHWLGAEHQYFAVDEDPNDPKFHLNNLSPEGNLSAERLHERRALRVQLEQTRAHQFPAETAAAFESFSQQAFDLVTGGKARIAFDIGREDAPTRERYGRTEIGQRMLLARRLVEAQVPFVSIRMGEWDDHDALPQNIRERAPQYDAAIAALIEDLHERGMQRQVLVVAMGEFGRTPRINPKAGRDHYPAVNSVLISGGDFRMGQVIGATDRNGVSVTEAPYPPQSVLAMVYRHLGIDPAMTFPDYSGRPRYVLEERNPIVEL